jgi:5-methylcytosine-specific restriction endonuclease McrA
MLERYHQRRANAVKKLGGQCVKCGSQEKLDIDHIDPLKKSFTIGERMAAAPMTQLAGELAKCQLLCRKCHTTKTVTELGRKLARGTHGTLASYRYCKCDLCREAWNKYHRDLKRNKRKEMRERSRLC